MLCALVSRLVQVCGRWEETGAARRVRHSRSFCPVRYKCVVDGVAAPEVGLLGFPWRERQLPHPGVRCLVRPCLGSSLHHRTAGGVAPCHVVEFNSCGGVTLTSHTWWRVTVAVIVGMMVMVVVVAVIDGVVVVCGDVCATGTSCGRASRDTGTRRKGWVG